MLYVLLAILLFGILIFIHELGHYIFARVFGVTVNEFSIGMGPKLISVKSKKTGIAYSLRLLPIGGFVSMAGEDEESEDPNSINRKPVWQRIINPQRSHDFPKRERVRGLTGVKRVTESLRSDRDMFI